MTLAELLEMIEALRATEGDTVHIEAKKASTDLPRRLWETLSAFSNTPGGGVIILGVDEQTGFDIVGVGDPQKVQTDLASLCDQMDPPLRPLIEVLRLNGRPIVTAEIPELPTEQKPCYYRGAGLTNGAFIRVADGDRRLTPYEVQVMLASRGQPREDETPVGEAAADDLDSSLVSLYLQRLRADEGSPFRALEDTEVLRTTRVLVRHDSGLVPSMAGLLALGRYPQRFFPSLGITFVVYPTPGIGAPGPGGERFLDNRRIDGPIPLMLLKAMDALKRNMKKRAIVRGLFREDAWEYPEDALREALINALAHRDYSAAARGSPVQMQMFPDRLAIINPGGLFGPVTVEQLGEIGVAAARNQTLMRILEDVPVPGENRTLCENRGSGIGTILASLRRAGMKPPTFDNTIATFRVVFPNHTLLSKETVEWLAEVCPPDLTDQQRMALAYIRQNGEITNADYRRLTGQDSREVSRDLRRLVDLGLLSQSGTRRWATYRLRPGRVSEPVKEQSPTEPRKRRNRVPEIIALLRGGRELSRQEIAEKLGIGRNAALYWLERMVQEGVVETTAPPRSRRLRYRLRTSAADEGLDHKS